MDIDSAFGPEFNGVVTVSLHAVGFIVKKMAYKSFLIGHLLGSPCWTRTNDTAVNSRMLYRLS